MSLEFEGRAFSIAPGASKQTTELWENAELRSRQQIEEKSFLTDPAFEGRLEATAFEPLKTPNLLLYHISADLSRGFQKKFCTNFRLETCAF
jgi:hypothetical protein